MWVIIWLSWGRYSRGGFLSLPAKIFECRMATSLSSCYTFLCGEIRADQLHLCLFCLLFLADSPLPVKSQMPQTSMLSCLPTTWLVPVASHIAELEKEANLDTHKSFHLILVCISQMHVEYKAMEVEGKDRLSDAKTVHILPKRSHYRFRIHICRCSHFWYCTQRGAGVWRVPRPQHIYSPKTGRETYLLASYFPLADFT